MKLRLEILAVLATLDWVRVEAGAALEPLQEISDHKDFKKILRTKTNVLLLFVESTRSAKPLISICQDVASKVKGSGSIFLVNCGGDGKKLCKKHKVDPSPTIMKHYKDGDFHKDYDRKENVQSLTNFLRDPTGDIPWEEDTAAEDVVHVTDPLNLSKLMKPGSKPMMLMAYAPWCKFCKIMKPDYAAAATELKGFAVLAAIDVTRPETSIVSKFLNVTGFPTLFYFENGEVKQRYEGENKKDDIVSFMRNPVAPPPKPVEKPWAEETEHVIHLTEADFDVELAKHRSALVLFYAPWCGHCKRIKPEWETAAGELKTAGVDGILAAVDVTKHKSLGERFGVTGYPTLKYFSLGELQFDAGDVPNSRKSEGIVEFMKDPKEPPLPPPPELPWSESGGDVVHLTEETFRTFLRKKKHVILMFYAPWCGHCKATKPSFEEAATHFAENPKVAFAAVDCTEQGKLCSQQGVTGYPTLKYFSYFDKEQQNYREGRDTKSFIAFMEGLLGIRPAAGQAKKEDKDKFEWKSVPGGEHVKVLSQDNFEESLKSSEGTLVMYFAPWCGHCKAMKSDYAAAAAALHAAGNKKTFLASVDCTQEQDLMKKANVQGFPTLKFYKGSELAFEYDGGRSKEDLLAFALDPKPQQRRPAVADQPPANIGFDWASLPGGSEVLVLTKENFGDALQSVDAALVMFYAPWCGHCKAMKEAFALAAAEVKTGSKSGEKLAMAAVDCTVDRDLAQTYGIRGFPTLKLFKKGKFASDYSGSRSKDALASFLLNPAEFQRKQDEEDERRAKENEFDWKKIPGGENVLVLNKDNFVESLEPVEAALVMYYAPWCGHCKSMKNDYALAAESIKKDGIDTFRFAAVDCTVETALAESAGVRSFPTLKYYSKGKFVSDYRRGRKRDDLVSFSKSPPSPDSNQEDFWKNVPGEAQVLKLNGEGFHTELKKHEGALVMFYSPGCRRCEDAKAAFAGAAKDLKSNEIDRFVMASVDTEVDGQLAQLLQLAGKPPSFLYFHHGEHLEDYRGDHERKKFVSFALSKVGDKANSDGADVEELDWPAFPGGSNVKVLTGDNFEKELKALDVALVLFKAPGCRHCRAMQRDYAFAAQTVSEQNIPRIALAAVDASLHPKVADSFGVEGFPALKIFHGGVFVDDYHGDRTYEHLVRLLIEETGKVKRGKEEL
ncbi:unnamed protein product [Notodromas monacha]|uniref:Thioredoxin domain-containing protein n=1 Tax=Notodromas monacha TaxID=399045 RepID=A0A7R9BUC6_9CRUS|nr:unnamed protein product [Notodromas monacha]CAG0921552.1 unnamed protein product [Notodromas monacha]